MPDNEVKPGNLPPYPHGPGYQPTATSVDAAQIVFSTVEEAWAAILEVLGERPMTPDEIAGKLNLTVLYIRPRCTELYKQGLVVRTGNRRRNVGTRGSANELALPNFSYSAVQPVTPPPQVTLPAPSAGEQ